MPQSAMPALPPISLENRQRLGHLPRLTYLLAGRYDGRLGPGGQPSLLTFEQMRNGTGPDEPKGADA